MAPKVSMRQRNVDDVRVLDIATRVKHSHGTTTGRPGDRLVTMDGQRYVFTPEQYEALFEEKANGKEQS